LKRREFIKNFVFISSIFLVSGRYKFKGKNTYSKKSIIRPPGAIEEDEFIYKCIRCGACFKVCPSNCLFSVPINKDIFSFGTPEIIPRKGGCIMCLACGDVCPSQAIKKIDEKLKIGTAEIDKKRCLVWTEEKDCFVCLEYCPEGAIFLDFKRRPYVNYEKCIGCGLCEENCPVIGESAISISTKGAVRLKI